MMRSFGNLVKTGFTQEGLLREYVMGNEKMDKQAIFLQVIQETYPDLAIRSARFHNSEGQFSEVVLIINEDTIFRFPRYPDGIESILREVHILAGSKGAPRFQYPTPSIQAETLARWARYLWDIGCFQVNRSGWKHFNAWTTKLRDGWQRS